MTEVAEHSAARAMQAAAGTPSGWGVRQLGELGSVVRGASPRPAGDPRFFDGDFIPWLTVAALTNIPDHQLIVNETATSLTAAGAQHSRTLPIGTLIIANSGATLGVAKLLGVTCCANDGIAAILNQQLGDKAYVSYCINRLTRELREVVATGNGQPNLNTGLIREIAIPFPPAAEQRAIAEALGDVDALLAVLDRLIAKKRDLKQAAMQQLLTGQTRLPGFTGKWKVMSLGELFEFSGGYAASRDELSSEGHRYLHYGDIHGSSKTSIDTTLDAQDIPRLDVSLKQVSPDSLLHHGDVVFVDASEDDEGTTKHVVVSNQEGHPFIAGLHTIVAKPRTADLTHEYGHFCFQTEAVRKQFLFYAVGTKVSGISKTNIAKVFLPIPSTNEQLEIASMLTDMESELAALQSRRDKTLTLKQAMMQELLTGRIRLI